MPRSKCAFRPSDVTRLMKAALKDGVDIARVEIIGDKIIIIPAKPEMVSDLDRELAEFEARHGEA